MKTKFAIGCLVQWYECDVVEDYIISLKEAIEEYGTPHVDVEVHFAVSLSQKLEKCVSKEQLDKCKEKIHKIFIGFVISLHRNSRARHLDIYNVL